MEKAALYGQNANKLMLIACKTVPPQVRYALHPGAFRPRRTSAGWVTDTRRNQAMWRPEYRTNTYNVMRYLKNKKEN